jgi:hypothetical protein
VSLWDPEVDGGPVSDDWEKAAGTMIDMARRSRTTRGIVWVLCTVFVNLS